MINHAAREADPAQEEKVALGLPGRTLTGRVELALTGRLERFPVGAADRFENAPFDDERDRVHHHAEDGPFEPSAHAATDSHDLVLSEAVGLGDSSPAVGSVAGSAGRRPVRIRALVGPLPFSCTT